MEDTSVLINRSQAGDKEAREVLIENNMGLVGYIVRRFMGRGLENEDLMQIGVLGLIKSIDRFDTSLGVQFSTYAVPMITGEIKRYIRDNGPIKISRQIKENSARIAYAMQDLNHKLGRDPTLEELEEELQMSREDIVTAMDATASVRSIYETTGGDGDSREYIVDRMAADRTKNTENEVVDKLLLVQLLDSLSEKDRTFINMRYFKNMTQSQIADFLGTSQVQVSRNEKKILRKLREKLG